MSEADDESTNKLSQFIFKLISLAELAFSVMFVTTSIESLMFEIEAADDVVILLNG